MPALRRAAAEKGTSHCLAGGSLRLLRDFPFRNCPEQPFYAPATFKGTTTQGPASIGAPPLEAASDAVVIKSQGVTISDCR